MTNSPLNDAFVQTVASELACGVERAVECWMAEIDGALKDRHLTTLGRMYAIQGIVDRYKQVAGKPTLKLRELPPLGQLRIAR